MAVFEFSVCLLHSFFSASWLLSAVYIQYPMNENAIVTIINQILNSVFITLFFLCPQKLTSIPQKLTSIPQKLIFF